MKSLFANVLAFIKRYGTFDPTMNRRPKPPTVAEELRELRLELRVVHIKLHKVYRNLRREIMASNAQLEARLTGIEAKLDESSAEITTELQRLRDAIANTPGPGSSPEVDAIIDRLETKANALADVGNAPPTP